MTTAHVSASSTEAVLGAQVLAWVVSRSANTTMLSR